MKKRGSVKQADGRRRGSRSFNRVEGPIRFGTSGWRGVLGEEVTFPRLRVLVRAICDWVGAEGRGRRVLVGYDGRFASRPMAEMAAAVLVEQGLVPTLSSALGPTPVVTHALAHGRFAAGLVLTASHNPSPHHGLKVFTGRGAAIDDGAARRIEAFAARRMQDDAEPVRTRAPALRDLHAPYRLALAERLDGATLRRSGVAVVYDAMHGAAGGLLDGVLRGHGIDVESLRTNPDPTFAGGVPDPVAPQLTGLVAATRARGGLVVGIANDGDGDRVGVVDGRGRVLSETQVLALLVDHLARHARLERGIAIGAATGSLVEKVARDHGLAVERHPIGFKYLASALVAGRVDLAGEESGGFALAGMAPDKDGMLAGALLVECVAAAGRPLEDQLDALERRFGSSACGRVALTCSPPLERAMMRLAADAPARVGRVPVARVDRSFGLRFELADGGFVMLRRSGTEPVMRVYAEAADEAALATRLRDAGRMLERAGR